MFPLGQTLRVLIVDDEPQQRVVIRFLLQKTGLEVASVEAGTVADGLQAYLAEPFDCVLLDFSLTDGTALDFLQKLTAEARRTSPIVILTAEEDEAVDLASSQAGADDFLLKYDLSADTLRRVMRRVMERHRHDRPPPAAAIDGDRFGRFIRADKLGDGGAADVYRAWDTRDNRWVALKILRNSDPDEMLRLSREAVAVSRLTHPNIATLYDIGQEAGRGYIAMQLITGPALGELPRHRLPDAIRAIQQAAFALAYAHDQGVIHRDLKPSNILVSGGGFSLCAYVLDFGLAKMKNNLQTSSTLIIGTPPYMSPEQIEGHPVDARSDVYSLGATLYHILCGRPPFYCESFAQATYAVVHTPPPPLLEIDSSIDPRLAAIAEVCLKKKRDERYATMRTLAVALDPCLDA